MSVSLPKPRDVYRTLGRVMKPWAAGAGFQGLENGALWSKDLGDRGTLVFWFQCDKDGGRFTLEFELAKPGAPLQGADMTRRERFCRLLEGHGSDDWLSFQDLQDVERWWTTFLQPRFERMVSRFLDGDPVDPSYPVIRADQVSLREASRAMLLLVPDAAAGDLRRALGTLEPASRKGLVLEAKTGEHIIELGGSTQVTTCRSPAGKAHRLRCSLTGDALKAILAVLERPPTADPTSAAELGDLKVWHHG